MTSTLRPRNIRGTRITIQEIETETLIYDERTHKAWCLNRSSACVWRLCDGQHSLAEIASEASKELESPVSEDLVVLTLDELRQKELLLRDSVEPLPQGVSRRVMMAKLGLTAAALVPLIAALTAPAAAQSVGGSAGSGGND